MYQHPEMKLADLLASEEFAWTKSEAVSNDAAAAFAEFTL